MSCTILTEERWHRFLEGQLTKPERGEILQHLKKADCNDCEEFLAKMEASEEQILLNIFDSSKAENKPTISHPEINHSIEKRIHSPSLWKSLFYGELLAPSTSLAWVGSIAVLLIVTVGIMPKLYVNSSVDLFQTLKQDDRVSATITDIKVRFAVGTDVNGELNVKPGINGDNYGSSELVFVNYQIPTEGYVYLVGKQSNQISELLYPDKASADIIQTAGEHTLRFNDRVMSIPLEGIEGRYYIVGIYSPTALDVNKHVIPLAQKSIASSISTDNLEADDIIDDGLTVDVVYFDVQV